MVTSLLPLGVALLGASYLVAADDIPTCSLEKKCPEETPCCGQYGQCGVGAYCLGGCDPRMSFSMDACVPAPVCESRTYPMNSLDRIVSINEYLGDPSKADFVYQGEPLMYNDNVLLTMPKHSVGTVLASTTYMWYGTVRAKVKTSHGAGVVTAFILFSDVKDEIDYEWVGTDLTTAQTNYYFQGIPDYTQSGNITEISDTFSNFHDYEISWTPDEINWSVDGQVRRTKKRADTWNATANQWDYPQTPSRVQLSLWPGGADTNAQGTIDWAGGKIDWESEDIKEYGYYFATFGEVQVECWDAKSGPGTNLHTSYTYDSWLATNNTVIDGDKPTVLKSFLGTGLDMDKGAPSGSQSSGSSTTSASGPIASVPGGTAAGPGQAPQGQDGNAQGGSGTSGGDGTQTGSSSGCAATGFSQDCGGGSGNTGGGNGKNAGVRLDGMAGGSALAVVVALAGMLML